MDNPRIIHAPMNGRRYTVTAPITQYDYGYLLLPEGTEELPTTYEVDFSNDEHKGTSLIVYGDSEGAEVPEELIRTGKDVFAFYYRVGDGYGKTDYTWRIPNHCRPDRDGETPTPSQQSSIDQLIVRSNEAVETAEQSASDAAASASAASQSESNAHDSELAAHGYANDASGYASDAQGYATTASQKATAAGNSADQAAQIKTDIEGYVSTAQGYAQTATDKAAQASQSATNASNSATTATTKAGEASASATTASNKASEASGYASTASQKATEASQSASQASGYAQTAESAKTDAQTAQGKAEDAQNAAETAQAAAESVAESIPSDYSQLSEDVSDLKEGFDELENLTNQTAYICHDNPWSWSVGAVNGATGKGSSNSNFIRTINISYNGILSVADGRIAIYVYDSTSTYLGWLNANGGLTKENSLAHAVIHTGLIDLTAIVPDGGQIRLVYTTEDTEHKGDTTYSVNVKTVTYTTANVEQLEQSLAEEKTKINALQVVRDLTNMSHCNAAFGRPQAIRINYLRDQLYVGYLDNDGNQGVASYNLNTGAINRVNLRQSTADDHNQMMVCETSDHKILAICADHASNANHFCFRSVVAEDISEFEQVSNITLPSGYIKTTYTQILKLSGAIYVFLRAYLQNDQTTECWGYSYTSDDGDTWSEPKMFVKATGKKYYACAYKYNASKIKVFLFSNYSVGQTDIRFCYIDIANDAIIDYDGTTTIATLSTLSEPLEYTAFTIIQDKGDYRLQLIEAYDGTDNSYVVSQYRQASQSIKCASIYCLYDATNNTWQQINFPYSMGDNISSGVPNELIRVNSNTFIASRHLEGYWVLEKYSFQNGSFSFVSEIARTTANEIGLIRPLLADGVIVYLRGMYTNYSNYNVDSCIHFLN